MYDDNDDDAARDSDDKPVVVFLFHFAIFFLNIYFVYSLPSSILTICG